MHPNYVDICHASSPNILSSVHFVPCIACCFEIAPQALELRRFSGGLPVPLRVSLGHSAD
jgi:hypothetical protein